MDTSNKVERGSGFWANLFKTPAEKTDIEDLLLSLPLFAGFSRTHLKHLMKIIHNRLYAPNEYVFYQGDPGIALYIIREGEVEISLSTEDNMNIGLTRLSRGDFFGEMALLDNDVRSASAVSLKESKLAVIFKPDLDHFIERYPRIGINVMKGLTEILATRLRAVNNDYLEMQSKSFDKMEEV